MTQANPKNTREYNLTSTTIAPEQQFCSFGCCTFSILETNLTNFKTETSIIYDVKGFDFAI
jgi:hypothetical protein